MENIVIAGGGIAGLSCLNALLDHGLDPLLLEANTIGSPKICGEFLAPSAVAALVKWGMEPSQRIDQVNFFVKNQMAAFQFPQPAGAMARSEAELFLAARARKKGGRIKENCLVKQIIPATAKTPYHFYLEDEEKISAHTVFFATGKLAPAKNHPTSIYRGMSTHVPGVLSPATLCMYSAKDIYLGIVPISSTTSNIACLVKNELMEKMGSYPILFRELMKNHAALKQLGVGFDLENADWLQGPISRFGVRELPQWPRAFWLGDTVVGFPPAAGLGFAHSLHSAVMAVAYFFKDNPAAYRKICVQEIRRKLWIAKCLNQVLLNPFIAQWVGRFLQTNTRIFNWILKRLQ